MLNNVKDFGALGDGVADDRVAIQTAIDDASATGIAGIFFPAGTYRVSRAEPDGRWSLDLNGVHEFTIAGEGPRSTVKLVDTAEETGDWHVFILRGGCRRIVFIDLVVDGNRTGLTNPNEQSHGIEVEPGTEDLVIDRCILRECFGDGVRMLGAPGNNVRRVRIENCLFQANKRTGLGVQRALEQVIVAHCIFDATVTDQSIDFEPSGADSPSDMIIDGCIIKHTNRAAAVTLSGVSGPDPAVRIRFSNNLVLGGPVFSTDIRQLTVQGNTIVVPALATPSNRIPLQVQRGGEALLITGNLVINEDTGTGAAITLSEVNQRQVSRALVSGNLCFTRSGNGIQLLSSDDVAVQENMIVATGPCNHGVFVRSEASDVDHVSIRNNDVNVREGGTWTAGIRLAATPHRIGHVSIIGNSVRGAAEGIRFSGPGFVQTPVCASNRIDSGVGAPLAGLGVLPEEAAVVGGATSRGGATLGTGAGRIVAGLGDPNGRVVGNVGDMFQRVDGSPGATLYVKESDEGADTGWSPK
jgi:Pectate lyase superfamily protein